MSRSIGRSVAVCLGTGLEVGSGRFAMAPMEARAVELALSLSEEPRALHVSCGPPDDALRPYFGMGLKRIERVPQPSTAPRGGDPAAALARVFAGAVPDAILMGMQAAAPLGMGLVPYQLARLLGLPVVADVTAILPDGEAMCLHVAQPWGKRKVLRVSGPFVATIGQAGPEPRGYSHRAALAGRIVDADATAPAALDLRPARPIPGRRLKPLNEDVELRLARAHGANASARARRQIRPDTAGQGALEVRSALLKAGLWPDGDKG